MDTILVSIICDTYNHADYIEDALNSFLAQQTDFAFEVLVHDDASTDGTTDIIRRYANAYPDIIKPAYEETNQYTPGGRHNFDVQSARVRGSYVALCEGDDYWTDVHKLQRQFDALETHPEIDICTHAGIRVDARTKKALGAVTPQVSDGIISVEEVIEGGGGYVVTNSIFMRAETYIHPPQAVVDFNLDYMIQIAASMRGGMYYLKDCMSAYRVATTNSWTHTMQKSPKRYAAHLKRLIGALGQLDEDTHGIITAPLQKHIDWLRFEYNSYAGRLSAAFATDFWKQLPFGAKLQTLPRVFFKKARYTRDKTISS